MQLRTEPSRATVYGVGLHPNIVTAALRAVVSAVNRGVAGGLVKLPDARRVANA